jgi:hypothetical protein
MKLSFCSFPQSVQKCSRLVPEMRNTDIGAELNKETEDQCSLCGKFYSTQPQVIEV